MEVGAMEDNKLKVVSLFSGCGGLDFGFNMSNRFKIELASDIDTSAAETYAKNFHATIVDVLPDEFHNIPMFYRTDISNLDFHALSSSFPDIDVVIGGPPCQDFSVARGSDKANAGITGKRGRLYAYFVKALIHLKPKYFVFENVPGIISDNRGATWDIIREDFQNLSIHVQDIEEIAGDGAEASNPGYLLAYEGVVDASAVGVPQKRRRVIIIGVRQDLVDITPFNIRGMLIERIKEACRSKVEGKALLFREYPLTPIEAFEGITMDKLEKQYNKVIDEWISEKNNSSVPDMLKWAEEISKSVKDGIVKNYCSANRSDYIPSLIKKSMEQHRQILRSLGFLGSKVCSLGSTIDGTCDLPKESENVKSRLYFTPPDKNYEFLYRYGCWRVEGKHISMIYKRIHPLKPAYTVIANGGGGTHGYHYERSRSRLTNREKARLQSFPDNFAFIGTMAEQRKIIGNAVPPLLGKAVAEAIEQIDLLIRDEAKAIEWS